MAERPDAGAGTRKGEPWWLTPAAVVGGLVLTVLMFGGGEGDKAKEAPPPERGVTLAEAQQIDTAMKWQNTPRRDPSAVVQPAPTGLPTSVALAAIREAGHPCSAVDTALRYPSDGSIAATCKGGERYLIFTVRGAGVVALNCAAAEERLGVECSPSTLQEAIAAGKN